MSTSTTDVPTALAPLGAVVLDCPDPLALAEFYSALLGQPVADGSDGNWAALGGPSPQLAFQRVEQYRAPQWPDGSPQQFHLDLEVTSYQPAHDQVIAMGATALDPVTPPQEGDRTFRVYADPAGHPFCLCMCNTT